MENLQKYQLNLRSLRENAKETQTQVAKELGIQQTVYSRYENGHADLKPYLLIQICNKYRVSADYVLGLPEGRPYGNNKLRLKNPPKSHFDKLADEIIELIYWAAYQDHINDDAKEILLENVNAIINDIQGGK